MNIAIRLLVACALAHALAACGQGIFPNQPGLYGYGANLPQNQPIRGRFAGNGFGSPMAGPAGAVAAGMGGTPPQSGQAIAPSEPAASQADVARLRDAARALLRQQEALNERLRHLEGQRTPRRQQ